MIGVGKVRCCSRTIILSSAGSLCQYWKKIESSESACTSEFAEPVVVMTGSGIVAVEWNWRGKLGELGKGTIDILVDDMVYTATWRVFLHSRWPSW